MKRVALMIGFLFVLAACQTDSADPSVEEQPPEEENDANERAVTDDYTRKHLVSEEQTEPGYYTFESELGKFQMLIPEDAVIDDGIHSTSDGTSELLEFGNYGTDREKGYFMHNHYRGNLNEEDVDSLFRVLKSELNYEGEHEELVTEETTIYYGNMIKEYDKGLPFYVYFGYIKNNEFNGGLQVQYIVECLIDDGCIEVSGEKEIALKLFESVRFK